MKIVTGRNHIERSGEFEESKAKVAMNAATFMVLSKNLYSNPVKAVIREILCNAVDANVEAGNGTVPVLLKLPNAMDLEFKVKDCGPGLAHKDCMELYLTYFESTKSDRNDATGGFGLGSKSPFAYVSSFNVTSVFGPAGKRWRRVYTVYLDETRSPKIALQTKEKTTDPTGLEVSFHCQAKDVQRFKDEATLVCRAFQVKPTIEGQTDMNITDPEEILLEGDTWKIFKPKENQHGHAVEPIIRMGNVDYPVPADAFKGNDKYSIFRTLPAIIKAPIGTFMPTPSRESLNMNDKELRRLNGLVDGIFTDVNKIIQDKVNAAPNEFEARTILHELTATESPLHHLATAIDWKYKGKKVDETFTMPIVLQDKADETMGVSIAFREEAIKQDGSKKDTYRFNELSSLNWKPVKYKNAKVFLRDTKKFDEEYMVRHMKSTAQYKEPYIIFAFDTSDKAKMKEYKALLALCGWTEKDVIDVASLPVPPKY